MATVKTYTFVNGQPADATQVNKNFDDLLAGINADVSATDKVLGRATAGAGPVEEIPCTAAGRALIDDVDAAAQRRTLGFGIAIDSFTLPANTTISAAGAELINDANAAAQRATLGAAPLASPAFTGTNAAESGTGTPNGSILVSDVSGPSRQVLTMGVVNGEGNHAWIQSRNSSMDITYILALNPSGGQVTIGGVAAVVTSDARLSDARTPVAHNQLKATITDFPASMPASDVYAWAKAASAPSVGKFKIGTITRPDSTASGDIAYTGIGFQPKMMHFTAYRNGSTHDIVAGFDDGSTHFTFCAGIIDSTKSIEAWAAEYTGNATGYIVAFGADGFTIRWTNTGSVGSVIYLVWEAMG